MALEVPAVLQSLSSAGSAFSALTAWRKKTRGDARALIGELTDNLYYLDMVAEDGVELAAVVNKLSIAEYKRLSNEDYNFNALKKQNITRYESLKGTDLSSMFWMNYVERMAALTNGDDLPAPSRAIAQGFTARNKDKRLAGDGQRTEGTGHGPVN